MNPRILFVMGILFSTLCACSAQNTGQVSQELAGKLTDSFNFEGGKKVSGSKPLENKNNPAFPQVTSVDSPSVLYAGQVFEMFLFTGFENHADITGAVVAVEHNGVYAGEYIDVTAKVEIVNGKKIMRLTGRMSDVIGFDAEDFTVLFAMHRSDGQVGNYFPVPIRVIGVHIPEITSFTAVKTAVTEGSGTTLTAVFTGGTGSVDNGVGDVESGVPVNVTPAKTTAYKLTVANSAGGSVSAAATVEVVPPPSIAGFTATPESILYGGTVSLTATFIGAFGTIEPGGITVANGVPVQVTPKSDTTYSLTVTNAAGDSTGPVDKTITVAKVQVGQVSPANPTVLTGGKQKFSTVVTGAVNTNVIWSADKGSFSDDGTWTAPMEAYDAVTITATAAADGTTTNTATARVEYPAPTVVSIMPGEGNNDGTVKITNLAGTGFRKGATVKLSNSTDEIVATKVAVVSGTQIACTVDLFGVQTGSWDVIVINDDSKQATLAEGFTVVPPLWQNVGTSLSTNTEAYTSLFVEGGVPSLAWSENTGNYRYLNISKFDGSKWSLGSSENVMDYYEYLSLVVTGGVPYIGFSYKYSNIFVHVKKGVSGKTLADLGTGLSTSSNYSSLKIDNGVPYVAYRDVANSNRPTVMRFNGTSWQMVGGAVVSTSAASYLSLYLDNGVPYVAYRDDTNAGVPVVMRFDGSVWKPAAATNPSAVGATFTSLWVDGGVPYLAYIDQTGGKATLKKLNAGAWELVGGATLTTLSANYTTLFVYDGVPFVAYTEGTGNFANVKKFVNNTWVTLGGGAISSAGAAYLSLFVYGGVPYLSYVWSGEAIVKKYDSLHIPPTPVSISPNTGVHGQVVTINDLTGTGFRNGASVRLTNPASLDIVAGNVQVIDEQHIKCTLDLTGRAAGTYDVMVTNTDAQSGILAGGFKIE